MLEIDEDDILTSSPRLKFYDMIFHANQNIVSEVLESKIEQFIAMEELLYEQYGDEIYTKIRQKIYENLDFMENGKNDFYINFVSDVLTKHE
ncbi:MAG: DUF2018 family protein [Campylobacteraceae bacterium]